MRERTKLRLVIHLNCQRWMESVEWVSGFERARQSWQVTHWPSLSLHPDLDTIIASQFESAPLKSEPYNSLP